MVRGISFFLSCFGVNFLSRGDNTSRVHDLLDSSPNLLHAYKEGFVSIFYTCKRLEKMAFIVRSPCTWVHSVKRERESFLSWGVRKICFFRVYSLGFGKREKIRENLFSSPSFFHLFISSKSSSSISRKVLEI